MRMSIEAILSNQYLVNRVISMITDYRIKYNKTPNVAFLNRKDLVGARIHGVEIKYTSGKEEVVYINKKNRLEI